jgi:hypothetical protein
MYCKCNKWEYAKEIKRLKDGLRDCGKSHSEIFDRLTFVTIEKDKEIERLKELLLHLCEPCYGLKNIIMEDVGDILEGES